MGRLSISAQCFSSETPSLQGGQLLTCCPLNLASFAARASSLALKSLSLASSCSRVAPEVVVFDLPRPRAVSCESSENVESLVGDVNGFWG
jgi:hypothetical protein